MLISRYDQIAQRAGNGARAAAEERISRVVANTLTSDVPGLIRPQYLDQIAQVIDASRPIVTTARKVPLTSGKLSYPSITQRPLVGKQATEKTEVATQKMTVVFVDVLADTYAGCGDLSWQAINWSTPDALGLWFDLAAEQYAIQTEAATGTVLAAHDPPRDAAASPRRRPSRNWMGAITAAAGAIYAASRRRPNVVYADVASGYSMMGLVAQRRADFRSVRVLLALVGDGERRGTDARDLRGSPPRRPSSSGIRRRSSRRRRRARPLSYAWSNPRSAGWRSA